MTEFNDNNNIKFVPTAPKIYEVRYVENKEPSKLSKIADHLGIKKVENCKNSLCGCSCSSDNCNCSSAETSIYNKGIYSVENYSVSGRATDIS